MASWSQAVEEVAAAVAADPGVCMLLGATDTGKTTLARILANALLERGRRVAVVDGDVGQSDVGPPATVGLTVLDRPCPDLSGAPLDAAYFVGSNSPEPLLLETVTGVRLMVDRALARGCDAVVVDTTGLVHGPQGRALKRAKLELVRPRHAVLLERRREMEGLLRQCAALPCRAWRLEVAPEVRRKTPDERRRAREARFADHLAAGRRVTARLGEFGFLRSMLGAGHPVPAAELSSLARGIDCDVVYAERLPEALYLVTRGPRDRLSLEQVQRRSGAPRLIDVDEAAFRDLLCGIHGRDGEFLGLAVLEDLDFRAGAAALFTAVEGAPPSSWQWLAVGVLRVGRDGRELGRISPGEV